MQDTLSVLVHAQLRGDILAGRLAPGERLRAEALRARYDVGGSPVREALMRLEAEGFVQLEQNKGFRVTNVSNEHLVDLQRTRIEVEGLALRWSIASGGVDWEAALLAAFHRLSSVPKLAPEAEGTRSQTWLRYHRDFHRALVAGSGAPTLLGIQQNLFDQAERYVALSISFRGELRDDVAEHEAIMAAAIDRNAPLAVARNAEHIERTTHKLERAMAEAAARSMEGIPT